MEKWFFPPSEGLMLDNVVPCHSYATFSLGCFVQASSALLNWLTDAVSWNNFKTAEVNLNKTWQQYAYPTITACHCPFFYTQIWRLKNIKTGVHVTQSAAFKVKCKQKHNSHTRKTFKGCVLVTWTLCTGNLNFNQWFQYTHPPPSGPRFVMWCLPTSVLVLCPVCNTKCPLYNTKEQHCNGNELSDTDASIQRHLYWKSVADTAVHWDSPLKNKQKQTDCPQIECQIKPFCMLQILLHPPHCFISVWQWTIQLKCRLKTKHLTKPIQTLLTKW